MSIWIEIHCDVPQEDVDQYANFQNGGCWTTGRGDHPCALIQNASNVPRILAEIGRTAKERGWKHNKHGWACPACVKAGFMAREIA